MYKIRRTDANQKAIVIKFRKLGATVVNLSEVGRGIADLLIALPRQNMEAYVAFIEVKDGTKPPSARKLTFDEQKFKDSWPGHYEIITSEADVTALVCKVMGLKEG